MDERILARLDKYERWSRRSLAVAFYVGSLVFTYHRAYKQGEMDALQNLINSLQHSPAPMAPNDGEPGSLDHSHEKGNL